MRAYNPDTLTTQFFDMGGEFKLKDDTRETYMSFRKEWTFTYKFVSTFIRETRRMYRDECRRSPNGCPTNRTMQQLDRLRKEARQLLALLALIKTQNRLRILQESNTQIAA